MGELEGCLSIYDRLRSNHKAYFYFIYSIKVSMSNLLRFIYIFFSSLMLERGLDFNDHFWWIEC